MAGSRQADVAGCYPDAEAQWCSIDGPGPAGVMEADACWPWDTPGPVGVQDAQDRRVAEDDAPATCTYRVHIGQAGGVPAVFEYDRDGKRQRELTFKPKEDRDYYVAGDLVLTCTLTMKQLEQLFPELKGDEGGDESPLMLLAVGFLLGPPEEYKLGWRIEEISVAGDGLGYVTRRAILFLDENTAVELETVRRSSRSRLSTDWVFLSLAAGMEWIKVVGNFYAEAAMALVGGGVSAVARGSVRGMLVIGLRQAVKRGARKALIRKAWLTLKRDMVRHVLAATRDFIKTFLVEIKKGREIRELGQRAGVGDPTFKNTVLQQAYIKAAGAFTATLISETLGGSLSNALKASGYTEIQQEVTNRIVMAFAGNMPGVFVKAIAAAAAAAGDAPGKFDKHFSDAMLSELSAQFRGLLTGAFGSLGGAMVK